MRRAAKRDDNERAIIKTWEAMGAYVESVSGPGLVDTLVHYKGQLYRAEVKGAKRGLTKKQVENFERASRAGVPTYIIRTTAHATALLGVGSVRAPFWSPDGGALAGAARKARAFRPGTDKARTLAESCKVDCCIISAVPGTNPPRCAAHAAEETFAPHPTCPACRIDPQSPCRHDGEEKGVAAGTQPPRMKNLRKVDAIVRASEATERITAAEHHRRSGP